jgi:hypothetical protein
MVVDEENFRSARPFVLDGAASRQKVNHQYYQRYDEQQVNQVAANATNRAD